MLISHLDDSSRANADLPVDFGIAEIRKLVFDSLVDLPNREFLLGRAEDSRADDDR